MTAIAGFLELSQRTAEHAAIEHMVTTLAHRGPDGRSIWHEGPVALGHCMLRTTPESLNERLPIKQHNLVITADARIDNRLELGDALCLDREQVQCLSDSELILHAYRYWGEACTGHLLGDFAFAIWDATQQHLFCARDHFGVKPFYFFYQPLLRFAFATEIKAIFCFQDIAKRIDEIKISDYILEMLDDKSRTFFSCIRRLPPASSLVISNEKMQRREYWRLDSERKIQLKSDEDYAAAYHDIFVEAVRCRMRAAFPVGAMLSGGLDSSSIACTAYHLPPSKDRRKLHTFSIVFDAITKSDERAHINKVLEHGDFNAHFINGDQATPLDNLDQVLWHQDEPFFAPNFYLNWLSWQAVENSGVRILLEGLLGDNVVSHGVEYLNELAYRGHWLTLAQHLKEVIRRSNRRVYLPTLLKRYIVEEGIKPHTPEFILRIWHGLRDYPVDSSTQDLGLFTTEFIERAQLRERLRQAYRHRRSITSAAKAHFTALDSGMIQTALEIYDKGCGAFHFETRFPFIDKRLVEFCLAIPGSQKISQGFTRMIMRRALQGILPEDIRWRTDKGDLSWAFRSGLQRGLETLASRLASPSDDFIKKFFDVAILKRMVERTKSDSMLDKDLLILFLAAVLSAWNHQQRMPFTI